uniref:RNA-dependent RNA polymerase n=1 Tax=Phytophthora cinnamomi ormycovirus 3-5 TaxID=3239322 RepID=A0AB39JB10_9VIRU
MLPTSNLKEIPGNSPLSYNLAANMSFHSVNHSGTEATPNYQGSKSEAGPTIVSSIGPIKLAIPSGKLEALGHFDRPITHSYRAIKLGWAISELTFNEPSDLIDLANQLVSDSFDDLYRWSSLVLIRLSVYWENFGKGLIDEPIQYLVQSLKYGPDYSKYVKKLRVNMFQYKLGSYNAKSFYERFEQLKGKGWTPSPVEGGCDYDQILNEKYLIHWEDTSDDFFDFPFREVDANPLFLEDFRMTLRSFLTSLNRPYFSPSREELKTWITDSTSANDEMGSSVNRTLMRQLAQGGDLSSLDRPDSRFLRTVVNVGPANVRDAWQCDVPTLFKVKRVSYVLRRIVSQHSKSAIASPAKAKRRRKKLETSIAYIMTDLKKCGLSFPRIIFEIIGEELLAQDIEIGADLLSIARGIVVYQGKTYNPIRGSGLGNLNEAVTLAQCIMGDMLEHAGLIENGIFFNDDSVLTLDRSDNLRLPRIMTFYVKMGLLMNFEKSFYSKFNVFCEDYNAGEYDFSKRHLRVLQCVTLLETTYLWERKKKFSSIIRDLDIFNMGEFSVENRHEFHQFESILPLALGGWKNTSKGGINFLLDYVLEPQKYLDTHERSLIPLMNRWLTFIFDNKDEFFELFYQSKRFPYRSKVKNPFNPSWEDLSLYNLSDLPDYITCNRYPMFERLYNERGLKNAKPKLAQNYASYIDRRRKGFFSRFMREQKFLSRSFYPDFQSMMKLLTFMRGEDDLSRNLAPPEFLGEGSTIPIYVTTRKVIKSRASSYVRDRDDRVVSTLITLASKGTVVFPNLSVRPFTELINPRGESFFTLEQGITIVHGSVPQYYSLFFRDKQYFSTVYYNLYGRYPESWIQHDSSFLDLAELRSNIFETLFGHRVGKLISGLTAREQEVFYIITEDLILDSYELVEDCIASAKEAVASWTRGEISVSSSFMAIDDDDELVMAEFPELAIQFLVEEYENEFYQDSDQGSFDYGVDYEFRDDVYDVTNDIEYSFY